MRCLRYLMGYQTIPNVRRLRSGPASQHTFWTRIAIPLQPKRTAHNQKWAGIYYVDLCCCVLSVLQCALGQENAEPGTQITSMATAGRSPVLATSAIRWGWASANQVTAPESSTPISTPISTDSTPRPASRRRRASHWGSSRHWPIFHLLRQPRRTHVGCPPIFLHGSCRRYECSQSSRIMLIYAYSSMYLSR